MLLGLVSAELFVMLFIICPFAEGHQVQVDVVVVPHPSSCVWAPLHSKNLASLFPGYYGKQWGYSQPVGKSLPTLSTLAVWAIINIKDQKCNFEFYSKARTNMKNLLDVEI